VHVPAVATADQHRFDRDHQSRTKFHTAPHAPLIRDVWGFVHRPADAVAAMVFEQPVTGGARGSGDGVPDVTHVPTWLRRLDTSQQRGLGCGNQINIARIFLANNETDCRITAPPVEIGPAVDAHQIAIPKLSTDRDTMHDPVVDAGADHSGKRGRSPSGVVAQEGRLRSRSVDDGGRDLVELLESRADCRFGLHRGQRPRDHSAGLAHHLDLTG
jgi:hypothetical protein